MHQFFCVICLHFSDLPMNKYYFHCWRLLLLLLFPLPWLQKGWSTQSCMSLCMFVFEIWDWNSPEKLYLSILTFLGNVFARWKNCRSVFYLFHLQIIRENTVYLFYKMSYSNHIFKFPWGWPPISHKIYTNFAHTTS